MSTPTKFNVKKTRLKITKSTKDGFYDLFSFIDSSLNFNGGTAHQITTWLLKPIENALESMDFNNAKSINITLSWKEDKPKR